MVSDSPAAPQSPVVSCLRCKSDFAAFADNQAHGCAADWLPKDRLIVGNYGSSVLDMEAWLVQEDVGLGDQQGVVCDSCLRDMISEGVMIDTAEIAAPDQDDTTMPSGAPRVTCLSCKTCFAGFTIDQAYSCASFWHPENALLQGAFGSTVIDDQQWRVIDTARLGDTPGSVCDSCIETLIANGSMVKIADVEDLPQPQDN